MVVSDNFRAVRIACSGNLKTRHRTQMDVMNTE